MMDAAIWGAAVMQFAFVATLGFWLAKRRWWLGPLVAVGWAIGQIGPELAGPLLSGAPATAGNVADWATIVRYGCEAIYYGTLWLALVIGLASRRSGEPLAVTEDEHTR